MRETDSSTLAKYIVCFAGARDNYEVAIALHQANALECLLTDLFISNTNLRSAFSRNIRAAKPRFVPELRYSNVRNCPSAFLIDRVSERLPVFRTLFPRTGQQTLALALEELVRRSEANVLSYAGYALEGFHAAGKKRKKVLFQYHPHRSFEQSVIAEDVEKWNGILSAPTSVPPEPDDRNSEEIGLADVVICASSVTRTSILGLQPNAQLTEIVPYGAAFPSAEDDIRIAKQSKKLFTALFVGTGIRRKGLHTLIEAWRGLPHPRKRLVVVAKELEPSMAQFAQDRASDDIVILGAQPRDRLRRLFLQSDLFILPSLVEGFGHVIMEALSSGCFVIASDATCFPDLLDDPKCGMVCRRGDVVDLRRCIEVAIDKYSSEGFDIDAILALSKKNSWRDFRRGILRALHLI